MKIPYDGTKKMAHDSQIVQAKETFKLGQKTGFRYQPTN